MVDAVNARRVMPGVMPLGNLMVTELRAATLEDFDFLYRLHRVALMEYVAPARGWDEAWQSAHFRRHFQPAVCKIIVFQGQDVGVLIVDRQEEMIFLELPELLPEYQRKGIGTALIQAVLAEAAQVAKPVFLPVLKVNPARRLYERLGFEVVWEDEMNYLMKAVLCGAA